MNSQRFISTDELYDIHSGDTPAVIVDVRTPMEYQEAHIAGAKNIPLSKLSNGDVGELANGKPVYIVCRTGRRANDARKILSGDGIDNVVINGGMEEWNKAGHDVVRGKKIVSIERQVRIAAGGLVLLGALLAYFVHIGFLIIPGFVGAGLIFAGITDSCAMGLLLARMPWNQINEEDSTSCSV